ncbi:MAG TPA: hypothetical protein VHT52_20015 [Stellaceae bacterium]|nr:hypothetical protein [Stellaceae bacterium]
MKNNFSHREKHVRISDFYHQADLSRHKGCIETHGRERPSSILDFLRQLPNRRAGEAFFGTLKEIKNWVTNALEIVKNP